MARPTPIYTLENCRPAYQLNWAISLFWRDPVDTADWFEDLRGATDSDGVRLLEHRFRRPGISQFLVSTKPEIAPHAAVRSVKGRLQYLVRATYPRAFRRNYGLRSVGSAIREVIEQYVRSQVEHHQIADPRLIARLADYQFCGPCADLSRARYSAHAMFWYNLHLALVYEDRTIHVEEDHLRRMWEMILEVQNKRQHLLSRAAILMDHLHLTLGCGLEEAPADVALSYMNNLAYACGMSRIFQFGYYVGTFGEYDLGVIPRGL